MPKRRTVQFKAWNASKTQSNRFAHGLGPAHGASFSRAIAKFHKASAPAHAPHRNAARNIHVGDAEIGLFGHNAFIHELIRGSLNKSDVDQVDLTGGIIVICEYIDKLFRNFIFNIQCQ